MKKLKVAGVPWHVAHQADLAKLPFIGQYDLLINPYRGWGETHRHFPEKCRWVTHYDSDYDFMIAHIDQQSIYDPSQGDRIHKGRLYIEATEAFKKANPGKPIIVINHMTPFHDKYDSPYVIERIKEMVGDRYMICNSFTAQEQWGFGHTVTHGMDVDEWWDLPKEPRVVIVLSSGGMEKAYRRIFLHQVIRILKEYKVPVTWIGVDRKSTDFDDYRDFLGRSLVFFNPTWQSPRPRAKTEAMLSGCCVVTTPYHMRTSETDHSTYIKDGETGFLTSRSVIKDPRIIDNPQSTADIIRQLVFDAPDLALEVGKRGKKLAKEMFNKKRFDDQWEQVLKDNKIL
jgi:glycosyltransferase involved in cell wall biosynthesis